MANVKITDLTAYTNPDATDVLPIVDVGADVTKKVSIENLLKNASSGTFDAPGIAFDGDSNTGIYRPGEDQVAISTNGQRRLFIDSSGNVGLGTSSPSALLHVQGGNTIFGSAGSGFPYGANQSVSVIPSEGLISFGMDGRDTAVTEESGCYIWSGKGAAGQFPAGTLALQSRSNIGRPIVFITGFIPTERVRIDDAGNVGIGTTGPSELLHVQSSGNAKLFLRNTSGNDTGVALQNDGQGSAGLLYDRSANTIKLYGPNLDITYVNVSQAIIFNRGVNESARIDSSGRLLVGTSSDSGGALLQVNGDRVRIATAKTPASASDTGTTGEVCWDASYIYVCTATNTWKRAALSTW